jgi:hypothetical protein
MLSAKPHRAGHRVLDTAADDWISHEEVLPARAALERFLEIIVGRTRSSPERQVKSLPPELCH